MDIRFEKNTSDELKEAVKKNTIILLPIGQVEEHGKHLPVSTDLLLAEEVACGVAKKLQGRIPVLVMPAVWSGYSTSEVKKWTGTISISIDTFMDMILGISGSLIEMGFKKIVLINTHGNHPGALEVVVRKIADIYGVYIALAMPHVIAKDRIAPLLKAGPSGSCHGGEYETSLMLYLAEDLVQKDKLTRVDVLKIKSEFYPGKVFISTWGRQKSKTGIYGDPTVATKETGRKIFETIIDAYVSFLKEYSQSEPSGEK